jgi:hypothetical protein
MANDQAIQTLVSLRAAVGAGSWLAPRLSGRLFGLDVEGNPQAPYLGRLFGVRDVALAVGLRTSSGPERARWLQIGIACDLADAAAGLLAARREELPRLATVLVTATALAAAGLGAAALQGEQQPPSATA